MADEHAVHATEERNDHGDEPESILAGHHGQTEISTSNSPASDHAIPPAEDGGHPRSVAAHLHEVTHLHDNKNAMQHHVPPNKLNEPPQEVSRNGKNHRRQ